MITKNTKLSLELNKYINSLDYIDDSEILLLTNMLNKKEKALFTKYKNNTKDKINNKRIFCFICSLIDNY